MKKKNAQGYARFNAWDIVLYAWSKKGILILTGVAAFVISAAFSFTIKPKYLSSIVMFPVSNVSVTRAILEPAATSWDGRDVLTIGQDEETEKLLQFLNSGMLRDHLIRKFNLLEHYEIDTASPHVNTMLASKFAGNVRIKRTEYTSVVVRVLDTDPYLAARMANEIPSIVDSIVHSIRQERANEAMRIVEEQYRGSLMNIERLNDSLTWMTTSRSAMRKRYLARRHHILAGKLEAEMDRMALLKEKLEAQRVNANEKIPQVFIVERAGVADKKAFPKRTTIVFFSTLATVAVVLLFLLIRDQIKSRV